MSKASPSVGLGEHRYYRGDSTSEAIPVRDVIPVWSAQHLDRILSTYGVPDEARRFIEEQPDDGFPRLYITWEDSV